jgi:hypothetical protein
MDRRTLNHFSMTCRHARDEAISLLFSLIRPLEGGAEIIAFCEHFLRHPTLIPLVRRLEICDLFDIPESFGARFDVTRPLIEVLMRAHNLEHLHILSRPIEEERLRPDLGTAIIQCPRLTVLGLSWDRSLTHQVLHEIQRLRVLCIHVDSDATLTPLIQRSKSTLEVLYVMPSVLCHHNRSRVTLRLDRTGCWPHLCFLDMRGHHGISTGTLTSAFPNLRVLRFGLCYGERCPDMRVLNEQGSLCWPALDYVRGTVPEVYNLALSSHIRELELSVMGDMNVAIQEEIIDIVQHTQPLALTLRVPFTEKPSRLSKSFCFRFAECARSLQYLESSGFIFDAFVCFFIAVDFTSQLTLSFHT